MKNNKISLVTNIISIVIVMVYIIFLIADWRNIPSEIPASVIQEIAKRFAKGDPIEEIATTYSYEVKKSNKVEINYIDINENTVYITVMKHLWKRKSASDNQSCNYPSQGTAAEMTKIAAIRYFNHLIKDNLIFKVLINLSYILD